ncbi:MAG: hypothetical protein AABX54_03830 [Nanoarchaeota archaeon]
MGGFFGCILGEGNSGKEAEAECVRDVFYGADYHSHLGTDTGGWLFGMARDLK